MVKDVKHSLRWTGTSIGEGEDTVTILTAYYEGPANIQCDGLPRVMYSTGTPPVVYFINVFLGFTIVLIPIGLMAEFVRRKRLHRDKIKELVSLANREIDRRIAEQSKLHRVSNQFLNQVTSQQKVEEKSSSINSDGSITIRGPDAANMIDFLKDSVSSQQDHGFLQKVFLLKGNKITINNGGSITINGSNPESIVNLITDVKHYSLQKTEFQPDSIEDSEEDDMDIQPAMARADLTEKIPLLFRK